MLNNLTVDARMPSFETQVLTYNRLARQPNGQPVPDWNGMEIKSEWYCFLGFFISKENDEPLLAMKNIEIGTVSPCRVFTMHNCCTNWRFFLTNKFALRLIRKWWQGFLNIIYFCMMMCTCSCLNYRKSRNLRNRVRKRRRRRQVMMIQV